MLIKSRAKFAMLQTDLGEATWGEGSQCCRQENVLNMLEPSSFHSCVYSAYPTLFKLTRDFLGIRKAVLSLYAVLIVSLRGGRNRIGRREKWPEQSWEEGETGGKCREEGEKET